MQCYVMAVAVPLCANRLPMGTTCLVGCLGGQSVQSWSVWSAQLVSLSTSLVTRVDVSHRWNLSGLPFRCHAAAATSEVAYKVAQYYVTSGKRNVYLLIIMMVMAIFPNFNSHKFSRLLIISVLCL